MGRAKAWLMEQEERGYYEADGAICSDCVSDTALKQWVTQNLSEGACRFCGKDSGEPIAASFDDFIGVVLTGVRFDWNHPDDEGIMYISAEGGYQAATSDTWEVLGDYDISEDGDVIDAIIDVVGDNGWVEREYYVGDKSQRLEWGWDAFIRYVFSTRFRAIAEDMETHPDLNGEVRDDARILLAHLIHFLVYCLEVTPSMAKGLFDFLFERDGAKPLEVELQRALWTSLRIQIHGFPQQQILREAADIGAGRADIAIVRPTWRPVIEIKRELADASREGIRKYLGQAASYTLTGPRLGFLVVLDLCSQREWTLPLEDNCWVETVSSPDDSVCRSVVVIRVPGWRKTPSQVSTPGPGPGQGAL